MLNIIKRINGDFEVVFTVEQWQNSSRYYYNQICFMVAQDCLQETSATDKPFYWANKRVEWSLETVNAMFNFLGGEEVLFGLSNNNGGANWKYGISFLKGYKEYLLEGKGNIGAYPPDHLLAYAIQNIPDFHFVSIPALQDAEEEGMYIHKKDQNGYTCEWVDFTGEY